MTAKTENVPINLHRYRSNEMSMKTRRQIAQKASERQRTVPPVTLDMPPWMQERKEMK